MGAVRPPLRRHRRGRAAGGSRAGGAVRLPPGHVVARDRGGAPGRGARLHHPVLLAPARWQVARRDGQGGSESGRGRHRDARGAVHHDHPARRAGAHRRQRPQGIALGTVHPRLHGADRAGLDLPLDQRKVVEQLRKELAKLGTDFDSNIVNTKAPVTFTKTELNGVPESLLNAPGVKTGDNTYAVLANVTWQFIAVQENAKSEAPRKSLYVVHDSLAKDTNVALLNKMLELRNKIALRLGYKSWDDYQTETRMAKSGAGAKSYIDNLITGIQPKFDAELAVLQRMKAVDTNDPEAKINVWDWRYYTNQLKKQKYAVDTEALRDFFPFQSVLEGMFNIYQSIFGLKFEQVAAPYKWADDLRLYLVTDAVSGEPLGMFYLDMFPREGKFNHFAEFEIIGCKLLPDGKYQRPTVALLCNFPPPSGDKPSLLTHANVETLFHEFGHALHTIVTRAKYGRFAGTNVPRDFVEAPSQMLQNWVWDKKVLDTFAADTATD